MDKIKGGEKEQKREHEQNFHVHLLRVARCPFCPELFSPYRPAHILLTGDERQVGIKCVMAFRGEGSC